MTESMTESGDRSSVCQRPLAWLNLGCGEFRAPAPWVNVDRAVNADVAPDVVADLRDVLPFTSARYIYCGHVLEHLLPVQVLDLLDRLRRIADESTVLCVVGPDLDRARASYPEAVDDVLYGGCRWPGDEHRWLSTETTTYDLLRSGGWQSTAVPIADLPGPWPVTSRVGWQFALVATVRRGMVT